MPTFRLTESQQSSFAAVGALICWVSLSVQLYLSASRYIAAGHDLLYALTMYFGYFTILSNVFCGLVFTAYVKPLRGGTLGALLRTPWMVSSATIAIVIVGVVYHFLLSGQWQLEGLRWAMDRTHHYLVPSMALLFWWWVVPKGSLRWSDLPRLAMYPGAYLVYFFVRGELIHHYPYFFMNVEKLGYAISFRNASGVVVFFFLISAIFISLKRSKPLAAT